MVVRDPGDEEPLEDKDEDTHDVWGLKGYYLRDLSLGVLVQERALSVAFEKLSPVAATDRAVAIQTGRRVLLIDRQTERVGEI